MKFAAVDIVFIVLIVILVIRGGLRGLVKEAMTVASVILGIVAAILLYRPGAEFIRTKMNVKVIPEIIAFLAVFAIVYIFVNFIEYLLRDIITRVNLGWLDRFLGLIFGVVEGLVLVSLILFVLNVQPLFKPDFLLDTSVFNALFQDLLLPHTAALWGLVFYGTGRPLRNV